MDINDIAEPVPEAPKPKRKGRGPGKKPALKATSIRLSQEVADFFDKHYPKNKQAVMRSVLLEFAREEMERINKEQGNGTQEADDE